jgi:hypothetical protein
MKPINKNIQLSCQSTVHIKLTNLSLRANIIALACSAAFPTIGKIITLINEMGTSHEDEAPCKSHSKPGVKIDGTKVMAS